MDNKFTEKITNEIWGKWWSIPVFLVISIVAATSMIINILSSISYEITEDGASYNMPRREGVYIAATIGLCFLIINLWNLLFVFSKNYIRKAHKYG